MIKLVLLAVAAFAALPPGYEDKLLCPQGYCKRDRHQPMGFAGPQHMFHECFNAATNDVKDVTAWGTRLLGATLKLAKLKDNGYSENKCECGDIMAEHCKKTLIPDLTCRNGMVQHGCKKTCKVCQKAKPTGAGCCVSYGFGSYMKECCHKYTSVTGYGACNTEQRMGGQTVFESNTCEVSTTKHEGVAGCCVTFGYGARMVEVGHKYVEKRQNACATRTLMGGKTVFESSTCQVAQTKHEGTTHDATTDPGCCHSFGYGSRMKPCCHQFHATTRATCTTATRRGGNTAFIMSFAEDACAATRAKAKADDKAWDAAHNTGSTGTGHHGH